MSRAKRRAATLVATVVGTGVAMGVVTSAAGAFVVRDTPDYSVPISYQIEIKAWIPFAEVVDPARLLTIPYETNVEGNCYTPGSFLDKLRTTVSSYYRGDNHIPYGGSYRVSSIIGFKWDGTTISGFGARGSYGTTHRDLVYHTPSGARTCNIAAATATSATSGSGSGSTFGLSYSSKNPLVTPQVLTPAIDSNLTGSVASDGTLTLHYRDDLFPSHGIEVLRDGSPAVTNTIGDASCIGASTAMGASGAALIAWGLTHQDNTGTLTVKPTDSGVVRSTPSPLCTASLWSTIVSSASGPGPAHDAHAALDTSNIEVAPIGNGVVGSKLSLAAAQDAGLVSVTSSDAGVVIASDAAQPVQITATGKDVVVRTNEIVAGRPQGEHVYGPFNGIAVVEVGGDHAVVTANGVVASASSGVAGHHAPVTRARVRRRGDRAIVHFIVRSSLGVAYTRAYVGRRQLSVRHDKVTLKRSRLAKLRFYSVDPLGDVERAHGLTATQLRRAGVLRR